MITITRHVNADLSAGFNHARAFGKLMPNAVNLDVEHLRRIGFFVSHISKESRNAGILFSKISRLEGSFAANSLHREWHAREVQD